MTEPVTVLSAALFDQLQKETFALLNTIDAETGAPTCSAISWIYAVNQTTLRFAIDQRSRLIANMKNNPNVTVSVFGLGTLYAIYGKASVADGTLEGVPIKLACIDVGIDAVREAMFYGARITAMPEYEKTYDKRAAAKLDGQVFAALQKA
ncbi:MULTISPECIES: pyridoxamine 5'-phosphate oxidase family protein [unclassified Paenibacillus]|uniref:pyridoxamine 5'-phosphate oxidase family protein n=1 Tax=unclassified Paenibacillus TaxID=185978 RepID=UPI001C105DB9|nr:MULTISPECIES: pyridoxamine 5'-phosphate oxidase family protein [unclassified Paenibacillus]MBU5440492.1 pyridoxamine 5'-phosphate oxidase family protein [Paenibacillus sp. MSJ-34]CAH0119585.1 hypothetical protein PAE9249_02089 [Paenibacillus sp. CECT 9249]